MSNIANISVSLKFNQVVELVKQLPKKQQQQLIDMIEDSSPSVPPKKNSAKEKTLLKGIDDSVNFVNNYKSRKSRQKTYKQMLNEL